MRHDRTIFSKPQSAGRSEQQFTPAERTERMRIGALAGATGRSRPDQLQSLMLGEVVGTPPNLARNLPTSFRAELHGSTGLSTRKDRL